MIFESKLPLPPVPSCDAFNYIFHHGRRNYSTDRVLYRVDGTDETLTFEELEQKSRQFADAIREYYDIMPNDVVAILAKDKKEMSETDVAARLEQAKAKLVITDSELLRLTEVASMLAGCISVMTLDANDQNWPCVDSLLPMGNPDAQTFELKTPQEVDQHNAFINRTSGSTGTMKSVLTSHAHYIATMEATVGTIPADTNPDRDVWVSPLSLGFFINAKLHMGLNILLGIPVVLMKQTLDETTVDVVARHHITFLFITPPIAARLARADLRHINVSSVKWLLTAGAPMHENLRRTVSRQFGGVHLTLEWATSETMLLAMQVDECSKQPGSSGTLVNGIQAKVINVETGRECSYGEEGEILVRNAIARFKGYKDNEVANRDFDSEGWFHTGDYGYLDQNCNVYIVDRIKELLKVGEGYGSHVSAAEIEAILFEHPAVSSVVVVGVRNTETQVDEPTAFVILKTEYRSRTAQVTRDIERYARAKLTGLRRLTGGVHCISSYPTTGFKINRRALKSMVPSKMPKMPCSVQTWPDTDIAVIKGKGWILGYIAQVRSRTSEDDQAYVSIQFNHTAEWVNKPLQWNNKWRLRAPEELIQEGDIICLLQGTAKPSIIRLCRDHFEMVMTTVTPQTSKEESYDLEPQKWHPMGGFLYDVFLHGDYLGPV
ncbi:unnamed protein product [Aspergillus oryzae]|nr:unnamed protein product [Aspergillus oryzae]